MKKVLTPPAILLKKLHALLAKAGIDANGKAEILAAYGVTSSRDLTACDLMEICDNLNGMLNKEAQTMDIWRKRVMAAIGRCLRATGKPESAAIIKGIACCATSTGDFNRIPVDRLRSLYNAFVNRRNDLDAAAQIMQELLLTPDVETSNNDKAWLN